MTSTRTNVHRHRRPHHSVILHHLPGDYAISRLAPDAAIPAWADGAGFVSIGRTAEELSIICDARRVPEDVERDGGWQCFKFEGPFDFEQAGIAAAVLQPLAIEEIGILLVSTFDTDYLLVKKHAVDEATRVLDAAGHVVMTRSALGRGQKSAGG